MPANPLNRLVGSLQALDYTRRRMEGLYQDGRIALRDIHSVYEALFLRAVTSFEAFLEELFMEIMTGRVSYRRGRVAVRMTTRSRQALLDILLQGEKYMAWLPFSHTEKRAQIYLKDGKPFSDMTDGDRSMIKSITTIRNAIAHRSPHAMNEFKRTIIGTQRLLPQEKAPAGFLRSPVRTDPARNRFEVYTGELARIARDLS